MQNAMISGCDALRIAIIRIGDIVGRETACLQASMTPDLSTFNDEKARALLHFDRTLRMVEPAEARAHLAGELGKLRQRLEENRRLLEIHAEAARRVTDIVAEAMIASESDGTYGRYRRKALSEP